MLTSDKPWWFRFSLAEAIARIGNPEERPLSTQEAREFFSESGSLYQSIQQLLHFTLFSENPLERSLARERIERLLVFPVRTYGLLVLIVCYSLINLGFQPNPLLRGKTRLILDILFDEGLATAIQAIGKEIRPPLAATVLGKTDDPDAERILEDWFAQESRLSTVYPFSQMDAEIYESFRASLLSSLVELKISHSTRIINENFELFQSAKKQRNLIDSFLFSPDVI